MVTAGRLTILVDYFIPVTNDPWLPSCTSSMAIDKQSAQQEPPDASQTQSSANGKGKSKAAEPSHSSQSLLGSVLGNAGSGVTSSLSGMLASQGKDGVQYSNGGAQYGTEQRTIASEQAGPSSHAARAQEPGPRAGFRTDAGHLNSSSPSASSSLGMQSSSLHSDQRFDSIEAIDRALHDLVRKESLTRSQGNGADSQEDLLDPAYHEAWARTIPAADLSTTSAPFGGNYADHEQQALVDAWDRSMPSTSTQGQTYPESWALNVTAPAQSRPRTAEEGGFMELLAAEEAKEASRLGSVGGNEEQQSALSHLRAYQEWNGAHDQSQETMALPPPDLDSLRSTDPREAMSFILNGGNNKADGEKGKVVAELQRLKQSIEDEGRQQAASRQATSGMDATSRRIDRRRRLAQIEYDLAVLERKLGYAEVSGAIDKDVDRKVER